MIVQRALSSLLLAAALGNPGQAAGPGSYLRDLGSGKKKCGGCDNPCTKRNIKKGKFYHGHCDDDNKYLQCDEDGGCFVEDCPKHTMWSQHKTTCIFKSEGGGTGGSESEDKSGSKPKGKCGGCHNPCTNHNIIKGRLYHEHCHDHDKFLQCDEYGGCFVEDCPKHTVWSQDKTTCVDKSGMGGSKGSTGGSKGSMGGSKGSKGGSKPKGKCGGCDNPCTKHNINKGRFYHEHCDDKDKFLQCDEYGGCFVEDCPKNTVWDQEDTTCVHKYAGSGHCDGCDNPCTKQNIKKGRFYHEHCDDKYKYIFCDAGGGCFVDDCPKNTMWSQDETTCVHKLHKSKGKRKHDYKSK